MMIKLSDVSETDSVLETIRETGLNLVHGDVGGKVVTVLRDTGCMLGVTLFQIIRKRVERRLSLLQG